MVLLPFRLPLLPVKISPPAFLIMTSYCDVPSLMYVDPRTRKWRVQVRILCLWRNPRPGSSLTTYRMILADVRGNRIDATVPAIGYRKLDKRELVEGKWYELSDVHVIRPTRKPANTSHPYLLKFIEETSMKIIRPVSHSNFIKLVSFEDILSHTVDPGILHDIFGLVVEVGNLESGSSGSSIRFKLKDASGVEVNGCARDSSCDLFLRELRQNDFDAGYRYINGARQVYCALRFWRIEDLGDRVTVVMSQYGCSRVYMNPEFHELDYRMFMYDFSRNVDLNESREVIDEH